MSFWIVSNCTLVYIIVIIVIVALLFFNKQNKSSKFVENDLHNSNKNLIDKLTLELEFEMVKKMDNIKLNNISEKEIIREEEKHSYSEPIIIKTKLSNTDQLKNVIKSKINTLKQNIDHKLLINKKIKLNVYFNDQLFKKYTLDINDLDKNFSVNIGTIDSRMIYYDSLVHKRATHIPYITIINNTYLNLSFNNHIHVPANSYIRYEGTGNFTPSGIPLGYVLKNDQNIYPDFEIDKMMNIIAFN